MPYAAVGFLSCSWQDNQSTPPATARKPRLQLLEPREPHHARRMTRGISSKLTTRSTVSRLSSKREGPILATAIRPCCCSQVSRIQCLFLTKPMRHRIMLEPKTTLPQVIYTPCDPTAASSERARRTTQWENGWQAHGKQEQSRATKQEKARQRRKWGR